MHCEHNLTHINVCTCTNLSAGA